MFHTQNLPLYAVPQLAHTDRAYAQEHPNLSAFYPHKPEMGAFEQIIRNKKASYQPSTRQVLTQVLRQQYENIPDNSQAMQNVDLLAEARTFTVCTAHQPLLFTGPLYFIYKIAAAIKTAQELKKAYPQYEFLPVYWIGSEDHDFDELNHCHIFGKKITWTDQQGGAVGSYDTQSLVEVVENLKAILGNSSDYQSIIEKITAAYLRKTTFAQATFAFVHELFKHTNLLILDQRAADLKRLCAPIFIDDLLHNSSFGLVNQTTQALNEKGFKTQAAPRPINLFYLLPNQRERLVFEQNQYKVLNTDIVIPQEGIETFVNEHIAQFSPNVILRPLMQEFVLPNLAYIGGGGEIAYWLERKTQFEFYQIPFPMLIRRPSALFVDKNSGEKMQKFAFESNFWFETADVITKKFLADNSSEDISLTWEKEQIKNLYAQIMSQYPRLATPLTNAIQAQQTTVTNLLNTLSEKMTRELKRLEAENVQQISRIKEKLFPNQGLQERTDNFIPLYAKYGANFINFLIAAFEPFNPTFHIFTEQ